ncbi:MAG: CoA transferase [Chloroflexi bacterium]|nr:CoA transferase [Chloroflexota bacterium]
MPALEGMRVLDMTQYEAGTSCTQALAWLGADVVKVEPPSGDPGRAAVHLGCGDSPYFVTLNSNKRSVVIDLAKPEGRDLLLSMAPRYDVFVENYGPGRVEKLGIDYAAMRAVHPGIIYARLKGFGTWGPYSGYKCYDPIAQAAGGASSVNGYPDGPPTMPGSMSADSGTGLTLALAITAAYAQRQRSGTGQEIEVSMQEAVTWFMRTRIATHGDQGKTVVPRVGSRFSATTAMFPCAPGGPNDWAHMMVVTSKHWDALCTAMDQPELVVDPRFETDALREENSEALTGIITAWTSARTKWEVMETLGGAGVPCSAVLDTVELFHNEHLRERGFIHTLDHPVHGEIQLLGWAPRMSESRVELRAAPLLGAHSDEVLAADLGLDEAGLAALRESGVVG